MKKINQLNQSNIDSNLTFEEKYDSLSGFNERFSAIFGGAPTTHQKKNVINIVKLSTPLGSMYGCATVDGVCLLEFTNRRALETEFKDLCVKLDAVILPGKNLNLDQLEVELQEYFAKKRKVFTMKLHTPGTEFQKSVWGVLRGISYGKTVSYKEQAIQLNSPNSVRAVASANGHNRISIIIPCHRVIGSNGELVGYAGGLHRKKWLLDFEQSNYEEVPIV